MVRPPPLGLNTPLVKKHCISSATHKLLSTMKYIIFRNSNPICKAPKALASEALAAGQSWVLLKSLTEEVRLPPRCKDRK